MKRFQIRRNHHPKFLPSPNNFDTDCGILGKEPLLMDRFERNNDLSVESVFRLEWIGFVDGVHSDAEVTYSEQHRTQMCKRRQPIERSNDDSTTTTARQRGRNNDGAQQAQNSKKGNDTVGGRTSIRKRAATDTTAYRGPCVEAGNPSSCIQPLRFQSIDPFCIVCLVSILSLPYVKVIWAVGVYYQYCLTPHDFN